MATEIDRIARQLEKAFDKQPWYGSSVMAILKEVEPSIVHKRIGQAHTICELVLHMTAWRTFVIRRLAGDTAYVVSDDLNFPKPSGHSDAWPKPVIGLEDSQRELLLAIKAMSPEKLDELVPKASHKYTWYTLLHGIIHHDIYHLGQIAILRKALQ